MKFKFWILFLVLGSFYLSCTTNRVSNNVKSSQKEITKSTQRNSNMKVDLYQLDTIIPGDNTRIVQEAINQIGMLGGKIAIPPDIKFDLKKLKLPQRIELEYYSDSDISKDAGHVKATSEKIVFLSNTNSSGIVNEMVIQAPFHPGLVLNVKKDISQVSKYLGTGQSLNDPARISLIFQDEGMDQLMQQYMSYLDYKNPYSGWRLAMFRNVYRLNGLSKSEFKSELKLGDFITTKDNASGHVIGIGGDFLDIQWFEGRFKQGDNIYFNDVKSKSKIGKVEFNSQLFNSLSISKKTGNFGVGIPNDNAKYPFTVGGKIGVQGTRDHGQFLADVNSEPAIVFSPSFESQNIQGLQIKLEGKSNWKRLVLTDINTNEIKANIGGLKAHTTFSSSNLQHANSSFNIKSIIQLDVGLYRIHFLSAFERSDFQVGLSTSRAMEYAYVKNKKLDSLDIEIVITGTEKKINPLGDISIICFGGDF